MKKLFSLALALLMLAGALATPVPAADGNAPVADPLDANLVVYYDFEGTGEEALKDKAPAGVSKEDLILSSDPWKPTDASCDDTELSPNTRVEGGKLYIDQNENDSARCMFDTVSGTEDAIGADIFNNKTGEMTVYYEAQLMTMTTDWVEPVVVSKIARFYFSGKNSELYSPFNVRYMESNKMPATVKDNMLFYGMQTLRMAATFKFDAEAKTLQCALMYTTDDGYTWIATENSFSETDNAEVANFFSNSTYIGLGKSTWAWMDRGGNMIIDNVRIYNKALSLEDVQTLTPFTPDDKPVETTEEPTEAPATNAPAKTEGPKTTTSAPTNTEAPGTTAPVEEKKGCGSVVAAGLFGMMVLMGGACLTMRKKEN